MMRIIKLLSLFILSILLQGCLVFHTVSYEVNLESENSGTVNMQVNDIRSDALNVSELEEDKKQLFNFIWKSDDFVQQLKEERKFVTDRQLFASNGKLNGSLSYEFNDITTVEGIQYQEPYYFLTVAVEDSIISTNGEVIISEGIKRIMWDNTMKTLKFEMFSAEVESGSLVELSQYLDEQ
jgi:hypothetical protein